MTYLQMYAHTITYLYKNKHEFAYMHIFTYVCTFYIIKFMCIYELLLLRVLSQQT